MSSMNRRRASLWRRAGSAESSFKPSLMCRAAAPRRLAGGWQQQLNAGIPQPGRGESKRHGVWAAPVEPGLLVPGAGAARPEPGDIHASAWRQPAPLPDDNPWFHGLVMTANPGWMWLCSGSSADTARDRLTPMPATKSSLASWRIGYLPRQRFHADASACLAATGRPGFICRLP